MANPPEQNDGPGPPDFPEAVATRRSRWRLQLVWLVPLIAVLIGGWLAAQAVLQKGPTITIAFKTGNGIEAQKTKIKFKDVDIGVVKSVTLSKDRRNVIVSAELAKQASSVLVDDTRFWVVRPRISGGTVSGLDTLLSGSYIGVDVGTNSKPRRDFVGLESPPVFAKDVPGREFILKSDDMGSLAIGTPIFFRRLQVGQVSAYTIDEDGNGVTLRVFINAPYDKYVHTDTRFWHASGVNLSLDPSGVKVNTQSVVAILIGGLAFQTPPDSVGSPQADANAVFALFDDQAAAMKRRDRIVDTYVFNFNESVRGLTVGSPVDFLGIVVGEVVAIRTRFDPVNKRFSIPVEVRIYPERITSRFESGGKGGRVSDNPRQFAQSLVEHGLRAQLKTGSLVTGQRYVALDFFPGAPKAAPNWSTTPPELPTVPGSLQSLEDSVTSLVAKLNKVPFEGIGKDVRQALQEADVLLNTLNAEVAPEARAVLGSARTALDAASSELHPNSALKQNVADTMRELARTAAAFRELADYLERHPEALLRGKPENKK
jgi:paraquat-inducible protein B